MRLLIQTGEEKGAGGSVVWLPSKTVGTNQQQMECLQDALVHQSLNCNEPSRFLAS